MPSNHVIFYCPLILCLQSFPSIRSFPISQLFPSSGQSIGASASASIIPVNIQGWFPFGSHWSCCCPRNSQESPLAPQFRGISSSKDYTGLIFFRIDWFDVLAVRGTLESLLQHHSSKVSILRCSAFLMVQFSHPYMTTGKTIALTRWTFVGKVMSLLLNMLSRLVITFLRGNFKQWNHQQKVQQSKKYDIKHIMERIYL